MFTKRTAPAATTRPARTMPMPAPVGGLNDRDSLTSMPKGDAVILQNWWVEPSRLVTRKGSAAWATGFSSEPRTIAEYLPTNENVELFAAAGDRVYEVTNSGPIGTPIIVDGSVGAFQSSEWCPVMANTPGGSFLYMFNGIDEPILYNGTSWQAVNGGSSPVSITGVATESLIQGCVFKSRLFVVQRNSMNVWYLPVQALGGAAQAINLGTIFQRGGHIIGLYSWTLDAGAGSDDHLIVLSSAGEVAVYAGTDPSTVTSWNLVGVFYLGRPIGKRPVTKLGGDLMVLCEQGLMPLSQSLLTASIDRRAALTDKIQNSINRSIQAGQLEFGWEVCLYPSQNMLILNVPIPGAPNVQYAMNTITRAWTMFSGWDARTFVNTSIGLMYADSNSVRQAWISETDDLQLVQCDVLQSFQSFGSPAYNKYFTMVKPYLRSAGSPSVIYGINGDYDPSEVSGALSYTAPMGMTWGQMYWGDMYWGGGVQNITAWQTVGKIFKSAALRMRLQNNAASTEWSSTDFVYQTGGIL